MRGRYYLIGGRQYGGIFPGIRELSPRFPAEYARPAFSGKLPELLSLRFFGREALPELDVYEWELFLISERFQKVLRLYEPRMVSKRLLLLKEEEKREYFVPILKEIPCLSEKSSRRLGGELEKGILIREKIPDLSLFRIPDHVVIRVDLAESLLKRGVDGFSLRALELA